MLGVADWHYLVLTMQTSLALVLEIFRSGLSTSATWRPPANLASQCHFASAVGGLKFAKDLMSFRISLRKLFFCVAWIGWKKQANPLLKPNSSSLKIGSGLVVCSQSHGPFIGHISGQDPRSHTDSPQFPMTRFKREPKNRFQRNSAARDQPDGFVKSSNMLKDIHPRAGSQDTQVRIDLSSAKQEATADPRDNLTTYFDMKSQIRRILRSKNKIGLDACLVCLSSSCTDSDSRVRSISQIPFLPSSV